MGIFKGRSLYLVASEEYCRKKDVFEAAEAAVKGGIDILQMREKAKDLDTLLNLGKKLSGLCRSKDVGFIVNDDPFLAKATGADGVHLGQEDVQRYPLKKCRDIMGQDKTVGISTHSIEQFKAAEEEGFDYIAYGPIFHTLTKDYQVGPENIGDILLLATCPVVFIGGINKANAEDVLGRGARNIAVIRAILGSDDVETAARGLKETILNGAIYADKDQR